EDLPAAEIGRAQVALQPRAQPRQHLAEFQHAAELRAVARGAKVGVITVLLAAARIRAGRLDVSVGVGADPDIAPGRRYGEPVDACARLPVGDACAVRRVVRPAAADAPAADAGH